MTSSSSPSRSARRRCATASTRCRTAPGSASRSRGRRRPIARSRPRAAGRPSAPSTAPSAPTPTRRRTSRRACGTTTTCAHLRLVPEAAHAHGALAGIELSHSGVHGENGETRLPAARPVADRQRLLRHHAEGDGPSTTSGASGRLGARRRSARATPGFDIVYVYGGHSYLLGPVPVAVLQPAHRRVRRLAGEPRALLGRDARGGARTPSATTARSPAASPSSAVGGAGVELDEGLEFVRLADHLVDLWDVHIGSISEWSKDSGSSRFFREGWQLEWTGRVREATAKPIVGVGRLTDARPHGRDRRVGRLGPDRRRAAEHRRPVPAAQDRRGPRSTRSATASAATSASPRATSGATSAARRTRPPARSTAAAGIPSASSRRTTPTASVLVVGGRRRPAWSARSCSASAASRDVRLVDAAAGDRRASRAGCRGCPGTAEWGRLRDWRLGQLDRLAERRASRPAARSTAPARAGGRRRRRRRRDRRRTGRRTASTPRRAGRCRAPTRACRTSSRRSRSCSTASARPARASSSTTATATSSAPGIAELLRAEGHDVAHRRRRPRRVRRVLRRDARGRPAAPAPARPRRRACVARARRARRAPGRRARRRRRTATPFELPADGVVLVTQRRSQRRPLPRARAAATCRRSTAIGDCVAPRLHRRRDLRRPPPRARDRRARPRDAAAAPARAALDRAAGARAAARRLTASTAVPPRGGNTPCKLALSGGLAGSWPAWHHSRRSAGGGRGSRWRSSSSTAAALPCCDLATELPTAGRAGRRARSSPAASSSPAWATSRRPRPRRRRTRAILNFALQLEYLQQALYEAAKGLDVRPPVSRYIEVVSGHEAEHVAALQAALGDQADAAPTFDFGNALQDEDGFVATAIAIEDLTVSAYNGQAANLRKKALATAASLVSVEARHAGWIRAVGGRPAAPAPVDRALTAEQVQAALTRAGLAS